MRSTAFAAFNAVYAAPSLFGAVTGNLRKTLFPILFLAPMMSLCLFSGNTSADDGLTWPVKVDMLWPDADQYAPWHDVGDVIMHNDRDKNLTIEIIPDEGLLIMTVGIHVVDDPQDFLAIMDKKGQKPKIPKLDFRTDYRESEDGLPAYHKEVIALEDLTDEHFCWGVNPSACPPPYVIVHTQLQMPDGTILDGVYAKNEMVFDRFAVQEVVMGDSKFWGFTTYPLAKHEAGHFIDANVMGLEYVTITQSGITGEDGQFWYLPDERIAFSLGSLFLGDALAGRRVSPADLFEESDMDDDHVINMAWLLQSLDTDGNAGQGSINISEEVVACLESVLPNPAPTPKQLFFDADAVGALIAATQAACSTEGLAAITREQARENLVTGQKAGNLLRKNVSKTPDLKSDKAKLEIMTVYVPALTSDDQETQVLYFDENDEFLEARDFAKPIVVVYVDEVEGTGAFDVFASISRDDGDTWKRRNLSKTADKSSLVGYPGKSEKPMLKVKDDKIFVAWTDKYCHGGRPGYAIEVCDASDPDVDGDGICEICRQTDDGEKCMNDYTGDDAYYQDDLFGVGGPQRSVIYEEYPELGEVPYSCVWATRGVVESDGNIQWFKPEKLTSGRRDAYQLFAGAGTDVGFAIVWQEDPKGLMPGDGAGPGDGWSGANTSSKTDIWYSYITLDDFAKIDDNFPSGDLGEQDIDGIGADMIYTDAELQGRVKALVPMSLPVRISDNEVCSLENMNPDGGDGDHDFDGEGEGTHRYCGTVENIGTAEEPGSNPLCAYTIEKTNPNDEVHHVCVTKDGRLLDGNTGSSRPNVFLQPYKKPDGSKSAWVIIGYEESKGVGAPPEEMEDDEGCGGNEDYVPIWPVETSEEPDEDRYKADMGKNVIYHSFDMIKPETVAGGGIINLPETDADGNPVYLVDEFGEFLLDWKGDKQLAYHNARRVRFLPQSKSNMGASKTVLVALYREGNEGRGKPADIFMRSVQASSTGNPYAFANFRSGAQNLSSVTPTETFQDPFDADKPMKMLRWNWTSDNLNDSSAANPFSDARAHRGALNGDDLIIGYTWTPNWGRKANDKYDFFIRRSFNGGQDWTTDPSDTAGPIEHNVAFRVPVLDYETETVIWDEEIVTTVYAAGEDEPARNVSNLRNNRISVMEPRLVKAPGSIVTDGVFLYPEDESNSDVYQLAFGLEFNQNQLPDDVVYPKLPTDIMYSRTMDKGQRYESVIVTPQGGSGRAEEGWNPLANDKPEQGGAQLRQTPDGSRMYGIWLEEGDKGSDILFRRVDYRTASQ